MQSDKYYVQLIFLANLINIGSCIIMIVMNFQGKPTSRLRPEFIIYDPYAEEKHQLNLAVERNQLLGKSSANKQADPPASVAGTAAGTAGSRLVQLLSPAMQRKFRRNNNNLKLVTISFNIIPTTVSFIHITKL